MMNGSISNSSPANSASREATLALDQYSVASDENGLPKSVP